MSTTFLTHVQLENDQRDEEIENFYSVEFAIPYPKLLYQFKLWSSPPEALFIVVKEDSDLLMQLKKGDVFKTKYYSTDALHPTVDLDTKIREIKKDCEGRFKGHYRIGLDILCAQQQALAN